ncbi:hypothetical protein BDV96DRAFT_690516 [Lophiotrema nucula]|uniref:NmrA-like domain-containing protein n=1 Tax=Lophiotrema nucula TaxID=690887 RepID=A0A6A5YW48_9PLEO|nr:hypothetical protein BDV96DRAFT_690516 [Lophiotrema nucula]
MIVLTGTTGGLGRVALQTILEQKLVPTSELRISASNTASIPSHVRDLGVEVRVGNLYEPSTLRASYAGADVLFLVSYPSVGEERFALHRNAIDAAKDVGIKHMIYTSLSFCGSSEGNESMSRIMTAHLKTEAYLKASGLTYTIVRMASYAHLWNNFAGFLRLDEDGPQEVVLPGDGLGHWADRKDLGEATARVIVNWKDYINETISLTGPELLTGTDIIKKYTVHTGRPVNVRILPPADAIPWHIEHGSVDAAKAEFLGIWASWHEAMSRGEKAYIDPNLERLLGRKPRTIDEQADEIFGSQNGLDVKDLVGI